MKSYTLITVTLLQLLWLIPQTAHATCSEETITTMNTYSQDDCWESISGYGDFSMIHGDSAYEDYDVYKSSKKIRINGHRWHGVVQCLKNHKVYGKVCGRSYSDRHEMLESFFKAAFP